MSRNRESPSLNKLKNHPRNQKRLPAKEILEMKDLHQMIATPIQRENQKKSTISVIHAL
jgi:hypothetical protein